MFYSHTRSEKMNSQKDKTKVAITMDYQNTLMFSTLAQTILTSVENYHSLCEHYQLADSESFFFTYHEVQGKKGADEACSMLWGYAFNHLESEVKDLIIFCNSCCGQNKNFTVFRMLHYIVHFVKRF